MDFGDDLVWTDTSNCDSDATTTSPSKMMDINEDSDLEKKYKKELLQELFGESELDNDVGGSAKKTKKTKKNEKQNVPIKLEPESDLESVKKKKTSKKSIIDPEQDHNIDDSYLELRVKKESLVSPSPGNKSRKAKQIKHESISSQDEKSEALEVVNLNNNVHTKKKHKKNKRKCEEESNEEDKTDLFSAEETIIGTCDVEEDDYTDAVEVDAPHEDKKKKKKSKKNKDKPKPVTQNGFDDQEQHAEMSVDKSLMDVQPDSVSTTNVTYITSSKARHSKISDRLLFEDDLQEHELDENTHVSYKLQQYLRSRGNIHASELHYQNDVTISPDEEVFLLNCPTDVDISSLADMSLPLDDTCRLKIGGRKYEGRTALSSSDITILLFENKKHFIKRFPLKGTINLRHRTPKTHFVMNNILENEQTNFIPLLKTKCRHPLFGPDYKKAIKLSSVVKERLQAAARQPCATPAEKKKKKKHKVEIEQPCEADRTDGQVAGDDGRGDKQRRKRRRESRGDAPPSKRARQPPAWDDERAIEQNLFHF